MGIAKGKGSSEFLVALLIIAPWVCNSLGIDIQQLTPLLSLLLGIDLSSAMTSANQIRETIEVANKQTNVPVWAGIVFIAGRNALKLVSHYLSARRGGQ